MEMPDDTDEHSSKRRCSLKDSDIDWLKGEIGSIKESLQQISARAEDHNRHVDYLFDEVLSKVQKSTY